MPASPGTTPPANWLSASPDSITLGCGGKRSVVVSLVNLGSDNLHWEAQVDSSTLGGFAGQGIQIQPSSGKLNPGQKVKITITNNSRYLSHQGTIQFVPDNSQAGEPASTDYKTQSC